MAAKPATDVLKIVYDLALLFRSVTPSRQRNGQLVYLAGELNRYLSQCGRPRGLKTDAWFNPDAVNAPDRYCVNR